MSVYCLQDKDETSHLLSTVQNQFNCKGAHHVYCDASSLEIIDFSIARLLTSCVPGFQPSKRETK